MSNTLPIISIIISSVALIVTVLGFFASLYFFREGQKLNTGAKEALSRIDERAEDLKNQMGQRFDKTLAAALPDYADEETARRDLVHRTDVQASDEADHHTAGDGSSQPTRGEYDEEAGELADYILRYFNYKGMRYTSIADKDTEVIYNLGSHLGFMLFDGKEKITFFGHFYDLEEENIILNIRGLLSNIDVAYSRVEEQENPSLRAQGFETLERLSIEVLVPEEANQNRIEEKCKEFQNEFRPIPVSIITPSQLQDEVDRQIEEIVS